MKRYFICCLLLCTELHVAAQRVAQLKQDKLPYAPTSYFITDVVDDRAEKNFVAWVKGERPERADLQGGAADALKSYITRNVTQDKAQQPISLHITKYLFDVKKTGSTWESEGSVTFTFFAGDRKLIELSGHGKKTNMAEPMEYLDEFTKKALANDLKNFDTWWQQNRDHVPVSKTVKVIANVTNKAGKADHIAYSLSRPLSIADFQGVPENRIIEMAATLSGIGMESEGVTKGGQIVLTLNFTPYFSKSGSWFKNEGKNPRVLAHEQTHFDITAIKACELVNRIRSMTFTADTYEKVIQDMMAQNSDAANKEEAVFDSETNHGTIKDKEEEWERKVKAQVKALGCY